MSDTDSERDKYVKDSRIPCKYGIKCYQTNPTHHQKYKHPSKKRNNEKVTHAIKKLRVETAKKEVKKIVTKNDVSDSDEYNIEDDSDTNSDKHTNVNNDVSDSDVDEDGKINEMPSRANIDSGDTAIENDKNKISKDDGTESNENNKEDDKTPEETTVKLNCKEFIKQKFLVDMPEDFYQFWNFCKKLKPNNPLEGLKDIGLILVGPFDVLAGKFEKIKKSDDAYLIHWRYYRDPPEFQTVLKGDDKTGYHIGYFRDTPEDPPVFLASNCAKKDGILQQMGENIFSAVNIYLNELKKSGDPFKKMHIGRIQAAVKKEAEELKLDLSPRTDGIVAREKQIVTRTFNKIGLVVPYARKTQLGYRPLSLKNSELSALLTKLQNALPEQKSKYLSELQPLFTNTSIATDECDFGTGIELGWDIISHGIDSLNSTILRFLTTNYRLINRETFAKITEAHMNNRKNGCDLSVL
ncbi:hypothetical protein NQ314_005088 [Rhamnusium bicolor]|uniref:PBZ-type domain-containing protein n=1 Tax=Rhamnusium bicolor TaxID=1586634 RepID=A0AAV8ZKA5_9CUCU|nr:hypothetical protein NQ314_005088 [Rhamnusium bicolor]